MPIYDEKRTKEIRGHLWDSRDVGNFERYDDEFRFFIGYAARTGGPILELACGAGRMMMELAKAKHEIYGIDASWPAIKLGLEATEELPPDVRQRIHFKLGDMRQFSFEKPFPLIIIPYISFWYNLDSMEEAEKCLTCILSNLKTGGLFIVDAPIKYVFHYGWWEKMSLKLGFTFGYRNYKNEVIYDEEIWRYDVPLLVGRKT